MAHIQLLEGSIQHADWGSRSTLAELQGRPVPAPDFEAELWLGAHPSGPARLQLEAGSVDLRDWIEADPPGRLGERIVERFGAELPFLLKLLAVERPLSLQVHPDSVRAREGYARESAAGISGPARSYRDASHKPELVLALSRFRALCGFRCWQEVLERLLAAGLEAAPGVAELQACPGPEAGRRLFETLLALDPRQCAALVEAAVTALGRRRDDPSLGWLARLAEAHPGDPAALAPLLLDLIELEPGQALFLPPGELHCYLEGFAVEVMAASDNVVRAGLTSKHVDVEELMRLTSFEPHGARRVEAEVASPTETLFAPPVREFRLSRIQTAPGREYHSPDRAGVEVLLCVEGEARIPDGPTLAPGQAAWVGAACRTYAIRGSALLYRVVVPSD
jgi:mannose-6-phosphate isomerase